MKAYNKPYTNWLAMSALLLALLYSSWSSAAVFPVSSTECTGANSLTEAVELANITPGSDTIEINAGLQIHNCPKGGSNPDYIFVLDITESLTINGNYATVLGQNAFVALNSGNLANEFSYPYTCPERSPFAFIGVARLFARIGKSNNDNSDINVVINELIVNKFSSIAHVEKNASLTLTRVFANRIRDLSSPSCQSSALQVGAGGDLTMNSSRIYGSNYGARQIPLAEGMIINAGPSTEKNSKLIITDSNFEMNLQHAAINWKGDIDVVSSRFLDSGGIYLEKSNANFINSLMVNKRQGYDYDWIYTNNTVLNVTASTLSFGEANCDTSVGVCLAPSWIPAAPRALIQSTGTGGINFQQSVIQVQYIGPVSEDVLLLKEMDSSNITADQYTFMQPIALQNSSALEIITNQVNLITSTPALPTTSDYVTYLNYHSPQVITPLLGDESQPGVLIDIIENAGTEQVNELLDTNGLAISLDVLGQPRVDANNKRNSGAVQLTLAPTVEVVDKGDGYVSLSWLRPLDPPSGVITGFAVLYGESGSSATKSRTDVLGASNQLVTITGLDNGTVYEFEVVAVNGVGDGPASNQETATPLGSISTPNVNVHAESGMVELFWQLSSTGGHTISAYQVIWKVSGSSNWEFSRYLYDLTELKTQIIGLSNGVNYEFGVVALATDKASSDIGVISVTPHNKKQITTATDGGSSGWLILCLLLLVAIIRLKPSRGLFILSALFTSHNAFAQSNDNLRQNIGWYMTMNAGVSYLSPDFDRNHWRLDSKFNPALAIGGGYQYTPQWSIEINYHWLDSFSAESNDIYHNKVNIDYSAVSIDNYYHFNGAFSEDYAPYVLLGWNHLRIDSSGDSQYIREDKNNQLTLGLGINIFHFDNFNGSLEWRRLSEDAHFIGFRVQMLLE